MRATARMMLIAGLTLGCGMACAQPTPSAPPAYSADDLYNLGNSYARSGHPGLAVLNYERALLLAPGDPDARANLEQVRSSAHVPTEPPGNLARIALAPSPTLAAWLGVLGVVLAGAGALAGRIAPRWRWWAAGSLLSGTALIALTVFQALLLRPRMHEAVVIADQVSARVSPVPLGEAAFPLRQAETVTVTAERQDFLLVLTRTGRSGWVSRADLGLVVPETAGSSSQ